MIRVTALIALLSAGSVSASDRTLEVETISAEQRHVEVFIRDPNVQLFDFKIDENFFKGHSAITYRSSQATFVKRLSALMPVANSDKPVRLPEKYLYQPISLLVLSPEDRFLYDGCYLQATNTLAYYKADARIRAIIDVLSFTETDSDNTCI